MAAAVQLQEEHTTLDAAMPQARGTAVQRAWAANPLRNRILVLRRARHLLAAMQGGLVDSIGPHLSRTRADTLAAEVLPLLAACKYLEQEAERILRPRKLGTRGRPFWLSGVHTTIERVPLGLVLVIAPSNYPLFLAGVQALQALAAGNAVIWKPGRGGRAPALLFADALERAGLPVGLLDLTEEAIEAATDAISLRPDKIFFTGSAAAGRAVLHLAADLAIPVVAELSGCDAVFVLPSADPVRVIEALAFGMRLNGSATCMAPRRLILVGEGHERLLASLAERFATMQGVFLLGTDRQHLGALLDEAREQGAIITVDLRDVFLKPVLVRNGRPEMRVAQSDIFAPVLTVLRAADVQAAIAVDAVCPLGLTASIFGNAREARALAQHLTVCTVMINDLIVPTADPRVPFGGRGQSGFGTTRGAEGLLEMTAAKTTCTRRGRDVRHYGETTSAHESLFQSVVAMTHSASPRNRWSGLKSLIQAAGALSKKERAQTKKQGNS